MELSPQLYVNTKRAQFSFSKVPWKKICSTLGGIGVNVRRIFVLKKELAHVKVILVLVLLMKIKFVQLRRHGLTHRGQIGQRAKIISGVFIAKFGRVKFQNKIFENVNSKIFSHPIIKNLKQELQKPKVKDNFEYFSKFLAYFENGVSAQL